MPNWYSGIVTIRGDIARFRDWYLKHKDTEEGLENSFAQTFAPLSSGKWNYATACHEWGVKWDLGNISMISGENDDDEEFSFSFDTAWNAPVRLWRQLELRYEVEVEEYGYEEQTSRIFTNTTKVVLFVKKLIMTGLPKTLTLSQVKRPNTMRILWRMRKMILNMSIGAMVWI